MKYLLLLLVLNEHIIIVFVIIFERVNLSKLRHLLLKCNSNQEAAMLLRVSEVEKVLGQVGQEVSLQFPFLLRIFLP